MHGVYGFMLQSELNTSFLRCGISGGAQGLGCVKPLCYDWVKDFRGGEPRDSNIP